MNNYFEALVVSETADGHYQREVKKRSLNELSPNEVLVKVHYSTLNYKDALSSVGNKGVTRTYPHTPGIDAAGVVVKSSVSGFSEGQEVIVTSYDLGMNTSGGFGQYISVPAKWIVPLPKGMSLRDSMIHGTAGFTAGLCVNALLNYGIKPTMGSVAVTGSTGGVGVLAIGILAKLGFEVVAVTGKADVENWLKEIGASSVIGREALNDASNRPMLKSQFAAVIDCVGGNMLTTALKSLVRNGAVACCGLVASAEFQSSIFPFILRGNALFGIDSAECEMPLRQQIWQHLATDWKPLSLNQLVTEEISLEGITPKLDAMLQGKAFGKVLVKHD
jgi:acrylyl-CoA reductase (NADPH)